LQTRKRPCGHGTGGVDALTLTRLGAGRSSLSADGRGRVWAPPLVTPLANANAKLHVLRLRSGRLACATNDHGYLKVAGRGVTRVNLTVSLSDDDGRTWRPLAVLEPMVRASGL